MRKIKISIVLVVLISVLFCKIEAYAFEENSQANLATVEKYMTRLFVNGYSWAYDLLSVSTILCEQKIENGITEELYFVEFDVVLAANSVQELDYYKGVLDYCETFGTTDRLEVACTGDKVMTNAELQVFCQAMEIEKNEIYEHLNQYIDKEQVLSYCVLLRCDEAGNAEFFIEDGLGYIAAEDYFCSNSEKLRLSGYSRMEHKGEKILSALNQVEAMVQNTVYDIADAVFYTEQYSSNPTSCNLHTACGKKVNTAMYNPAYENWANIHSDCANFMSQALYTAGIPTDSLWYPGSDTWINVAMLCSHMLNEGYWEEITADSLWVGDYMRYIGTEEEPESHIVLITAFDGASYRYTAHTNDRKNYETDLNSSPRKFYRVIY